MPRSVLVQRPFLLLVAAYFISAFGDHLLEFGLIREMGIEDSTAKTRVGAQLLFFFFLPYVVLGPLAGWIADRVSRRGVMVFADVARAAIAGSLPWTLHLLPSESWAMMLPILGLGIFACLFNPARQALVPHVVPPAQLTQANSVFSAIAPVASIFSYVVGAEIARRSTTTSFLADSATFVVSAVLVLMIVLPERGARRPTAAGGGMLAGLRYVATHRRVRDLMVFTATFWTVAGVFSSVMPTVVYDWYQLEFAWLGHFKATLGIGMIGGGVVLGFIGNALRPHVTILTGLIGAGAGLLAMAGVPWAWAGAGCGMVTGACGVWILISANTLLQRIVPDRMRGRVFGVVDLFNMLGMVAATFVLGILPIPQLDAWVAVVLAASGGVMVLGGVVLWRHHAQRMGFPASVAAIVWLNDVVSRRWYRVQRIGRCTVPTVGPCIVAANHTSSTDPCFISATSPNRVFGYMIATEYADLPLWRHLIHHLGCIRVRRDGHDLAAARQALRQLRDGRALGVFIEGRVPDRDAERVPLDGVALLALRSGAPVVPVHISGVRYRDGIAAPFFVRHRVRIRYGAPIRLAADRAAGNRDDVRAATARIWAAIEGLAPSDGAVYLPDA